MATFSLYSNIKSIYTTAGYVIRRYTGWKCVCIKCIIDIVVFVVDGYSRMNIFLIFIPHITPHITPIFIPSIKKKKFVKKYRESIEGKLEKVNYCVYLGLSKIKSKWRIFCNLYTSSPCSLYLVELMEKDILPQLKPYMHIQTFIPPRSRQMTPFFPGGMGSFP